MSYYDQIKELAKKGKVSVKELLALAPNNDPFYVGMPSELAMSEWAGKTYQRFSADRPGAELHVRRMHYYLLSLADVRRPDGSLYVNTDACWNFCVQAFKLGRYLGTVPMGSLVDRKNETEQHAYYWTHETIDDKIDEISAESLADTIAEDFYLYNQQLAQPYHLEIWIEKSTMNDVIVPVAQRYGIDLVIGEGEISLTQVNLLMNKAIAIQKPVRVFYICDFDPKGRDMPVSIARKIEWFIRNYKECKDLDVKLQHLMLTKEQCIKYELPRTPVKKAEGVGTGAKAYDTLTKRFEAKFGEGATELDALEALHPGEMTRIIEEAVKPYYDEELARTIRAQNRKIQEAVKEAILKNEEVLKDVLTDIDYEKARQLYEEFEVPKPEQREIDESDFLLDSSVDYAEQLRRYKLFKKGLSWTN